VSGIAPISPSAFAGGAQWYYWTRDTNDAFAAANRLLKSGQEVYTLAKSSGTMPAGTFVVHSASATDAMLRTLAAQRGVAFHSLTAAPAAGDMTRLHLPRVALWDVYGGEISSGWMRYVFDQFEFPYDVVFANDIDNSDLSAKYDVLILPDGATLSSAPDSATSFQFRGQPPADKIPAQWRSHLGRITNAKSLPRIKSFVESGGTLLALGDASEIGYKLDLPVKDAVVGDDNKPLPTAKYYVPGSVLSVAVDSTNALAWGMNSHADIFYDNNPAFRLDEGARAKDVKRVAWFDSPAPLRRGWAWGQKVLDGATEILAAPLGKGNVVLYGPQVHFRGQTHGAFRFLFNGIYYGQVSDR
jgi:hypothetical protein